MRTVLKMLLCICFLTAIANARVDSRTYNTNVAWLNPRSIKVYIEDSPKAHIYTRAFNIWDDALRSDLNFKFVSNPNEADIVAGYIDKLPPNVAGHAVSQKKVVQGKYYLDKVKIEVLTQDDLGARRSDGQLLKVILHEIGHAIGISGHSDSINDIMYYSDGSTKNTSPSLRDIETVKEIYGF